MPYRLANARNVGSKARKTAMASRRALEAAACSEAGRIGTMAASSSSLASMRAISFKNASARFGPITRRCAQIATRIITISGLGIGMSSGFTGRSSSVGTGLPPVGFPPDQQPSHSSAAPGVNGRGQSLGNHGADRAMSPAGALVAFGGVYGFTSANLGPGSV